MFHPDMFSTYRLQMNSQFSLKNLSKTLDYLYQLGITTLYTSPLFQARKGSTHGYDVISFEKLNSELGTENDLKAIHQFLKKHQMGWLLDIVPNHMALSDKNTWFKDVLQFGTKSRYAKSFAIDWDQSHSRLVLPILEKPLKQCLKTHDIKLIQNKEEFSIKYKSWDFPLSPHSHPKKISEKIKVENLLKKQYYKLVYWKKGATLRNYRRFFNIDQLISMHPEEPETFRNQHQKVFEWIQNSWITALRIDHIDGLRHPKNYLENLSSCLKREINVTPHLIVEKILAKNESLPPTWKCDGTTGYDFLNAVSCLFIDWKNRKHLKSIYEKFTNHSSDYEEVEFKAKNFVLQHLFPKEFEELTKSLLHLKSATNLNKKIVRNVLSSFISSYPVYRTYFDGKSFSQTDKKLISNIFSTLKKSITKKEVSAFSFLKKVFINLSSFTKREQSQISDWILDFQQLTAPVVAKGVEDTIFYRHFVLSSLNEVGGYPGKDSFHDKELHRFFKKRQKHWPLSLNTTSTHDTKRSEDVRSRIHVLSEIPQEWHQNVKKWLHWNQSFKNCIKGKYFPDPHIEYLIYQTLFGVWPLNNKITSKFTERLQNYMLKAAKEAKIHTSWQKPNLQYEKNLQAFISQVLNPQLNSRFISHFQNFQNKYAFYGALNSLSQVILKMTAPGTPDIYQGNELWDFSLVDPDNRRRVNYQKIIRRLKNITKNKKSFLQLLKTWKTGEIKLYVLHTLLQLRKSHHDLFQKGAYNPIIFKGQYKKHLFGFLREYNSRTLLIVIPRLLTQIHFLERNTWKKTSFELPLKKKQTWKSVLEEKTNFILQNQNSVGHIFSEFPFSVLISEKKRNRKDNSDNHSHSNNRDLADTHVSAP